ncbi:MULTISPECIES: metal ABC transporter substrate-binding protein [Prochlorococcus]|uniref:metal ABC transporter substrate-binding protein n=1 Tax=Prochlorococcus TaxID=1218 RepID=UPI0005338F5A|nr:MULTISPECIES: metal ABC transporter substrate-binding protein [Prochlorococcus]KGG12297.1 Manganese ABC transporter [Prochlorococcus sp. MIT 0601]
MKLKLLIIRLLKLDYLSIKSFIGFIIFISLSFPTIGCRQSTKIENKLINSEKPLVLTTFTVLADISRNIAGNRLIIQSITKQGSEIHGYQPTPSDLIRASKADLIVENGLGLELWAKNFIALAGDVPVVVLSEGMKPLFISSDIYKGKPNPHAWMSPKRAIYYVDRLLDAFISLDPAGEEIYKRNADLYKRRLDLLDKQLTTSLNAIPEDQRLIVSCEGAFSYLANDYGLQEAYLWPVNAESQVTPKRMMNLIKVVKEKKVPAIFCESTVSSKAQLEVARITGAKFGGTFYVDSLSDDDGPAPTFIKLQMHNVNLLLQGLGK